MSIFQQVKRVKCGRRASRVVTVWRIGHAWSGCTLPPSLDAYAGKRVGLVRMGKGPATLCGYATIGDAIPCETFGPGACVDGISYDRPGYGYPLYHVTRCRPRVVTSRGIVARKI